MARGEAEEDERAIVARIRAGDAQAYESLFRTYYAGLIEFATRYVKSPESAAEIVSDVFAAIWERRAAWAPVSLDGYLFGAVRNRALNMSRTAHTRAMALRSEHALGVPLAHGQIPAPDAALDDVEREVVLARALRTLSERQRLVLILRWRHTLPWPAIAEALGVTPAAAKMYHSRTLEMVRGLVRSYLDA